MQELAARIDALRAAGAMERLAQAFGDFPWVDGFVTGPSPDGRGFHTPAPYLQGPDGRKTSPLDVARAFERVDESARLAQDRAQLSQSLLSAGARDPLDMLGELIGSPGGWTPSVEHREPSARERELTEQFQALRPVLDLPSAQQAQEAFRRAFSTLRESSLSAHALSKARHARKGPASSIALAFDLPQIACALEAVELRAHAQHGPAQTAPGAPRL